MFLRQRNSIYKIQIFQSFHWFPFFFLYIFYGYIFFINICQNYIKILDKETQ
jgi:hypothetical protein